MDSSNTIVRKLDVSILPKQRNLIMTIYLPRSLTQQSQELYHLSFLNRTLWIAIIATSKVLHSSPSFHSGFTISEMKPLETSG